LSAYASTNKAVLRFNYISGMGGSINIDNLNVSNSSTSVSATSTKTVRIYPNPACNQVTINVGDMLVSRISLTDLTGKILRDLETGQTTKRETNLSLLDLPAGLYLLKIETPEGTSVEKLTVKK
jgi:hypothetical protein